MSVAPVNPLARTFIAIGALLLAAGVVLGAVGAHSKGAHPDAAKFLGTAVLYQLVHALGIIGVGILAHVTGPSRLLRISGVLLIAGVAMFCGSLQVLAWTGVNVGPIAPAGGFAMIAGWASLAAWALLARSR